MNQEENNTSKCPICGRPTHKESKYCIFHARVEEKTEEEFKKALKKYIHEIKKEDKDYNFERFIFVGEMNFVEDLNITILKNAYFQEATFQDLALFWGVTFEGNASFWRTTFQGDACFWETNFQGDAFFGGATFKLEAGFWEANFQREANFQGVTFHSNANFQVKSFMRDVTFCNVTVFPGKKLNLKVENNNVNISFAHSHLENVYLDINLGIDVLIDFTNALLKNTKIQRDQIENHILQEKKKEFSKAQQVFLLLKNNFQSIGRYNDESWAYIKERDMDRLSYSFANSKKITIHERNYMKIMNELNPDTSKKKNIFYRFILRIKSFIKWFFSKNFLNWLNLTISNLIYGYGEKPQNVVISAGVIIILFALLFSSIGISNPEIIDLKGITVDQNTGNIVDSASKGLLKNNVIRNIPDSLYFSLITFTTLGYGDFRPLEGWGRILAGSEAFIGAFMMALFVYTFARRTGGR